MPASEIGALSLSELQSVRLLRADPSLGDALDPRRFDAARERIVATSAVLGASIDPSDSLGKAPAPDTTLLVVAGLLLRRLVIDQRPRCELLGPGDVIRPWDLQMIGGLPAEPSMQWRVATPTRVVVLDGRLIASAAAWPEVVRELISRAVRRSHSLAVLLAASSLPRVEDRLAVVFWHLAERWGRVTPEGVRLQLPLTHGLLGELIGAQRPTVTTALRHLSDSGSIVRNGDDSWLLGALEAEGAHLPPSAA